MTKGMRRRISPKLRMVANGSESVNIARSELAAAVRVSSSVSLKNVPPVRSMGAQSIDRDALPKQAKRGHLKEPANRVEVSAFVELEDSSQAPNELKAYTTRQRENLVSASIPLHRLDAILEAKGVTAVEIGDALSFNPPLESSESSAPSVGDRKIPQRRLHHDGKGVLVGIVDVGGFDFAHRDFLDSAGKTRFEAIWDQGSENTAAPGGFDYGRVISKADMNDAIQAASAPGGLPATALEAQSQMVKGSHGTHVASIAAGNRGVARRSAIAGVIVSLAPGDSDRRRSFYDSTRVAHAIDWLLELGRKLGMPVSINISLGTNGHAHDASSGGSRWIDYALTKPGRAVTIAAGNAGQEAPQSPGDTGYVMGRIHTSGRIASAGLSHDLEWIVVGNTISDLSENELELWHEPQDRLAVEVLPPGSDTWIGPVEPGDFIENRELPDGTFLSVYNELYNSSNGSNQIAVYLSPFLSPDGVVGVTGGQWTVRVTGREIRDGRYHAWIERDDPRRVGSPQSRYWTFPSFFSTRTNVDSSSVSSLACGHRVIGVGNLDESSMMVNVSSSQGPTRDGRNKPDVCAAGTKIAAANGFASADEPWVQKTGTSMAAPYVTGVAALMLAAEPELTAAQMLGIMRRSARPLPGSDYTWANDAGFGAVDAEHCVVEAHGVRERRDLTS